MTNDRLVAAIRHVSVTRGKRARGRLLAAAEQALRPPGSESRAAVAAEAIELVHTYSLIHDDLPAMGDGLQARAFELLAADETLSALQRVDLIACLARAAGFEGMVGGQSIDIEATNRDLDLEELKAMHAMKTGALITAALEMGAIIGEADEDQRGILREVGALIGLAFQIIDDVLDVRSDSSTLGKTSGKDAEANKSTYVKLLGLEAAEAEAQRLHDAALELLADWGTEADELRGLLSQMVRRDH